MRYLALDYGRKRIGLAISDPLGITAQPAGYFINQSPKIFQEIEQLIQEREIDALVFGYPRRFNGTPGEMAKEVEKFAQKVSERVKKPIHFWDERLSTAESEQILIEADVRRSKRKEVRDAMAASLILQGFLQSKSGAGS